MLKTEEEILNEVSKELNTGGISGEFYWDTCIEAMKRFHNQFEKEPEIEVDLTTSLKLGSLEVCLKDHEGDFELSIEDENSGLDTYHFISEDSAKKIIAFWQAQIKK